MITLRDLTPENFQECVNLTVSDAQRDFIWPTVHAIAYSKVDPRYRPFAVYADETLIGFVMYGMTEPNVCSIDSILIDQRYQGKGYGRAVMNVLIDRFDTQADCYAVKLTHDPANIVAARLYASLGFVYTDEFWYGEQVMQLTFGSGQ